MARKKLRGAFVGGGVGSLIGPVHHTAILMDGAATLVAGVFSRDQEKNRASGEYYGVDRYRCYPSVEELVAKERDLDWVSVMSPNNAHRAQIETLVGAGIPVISDKPLTTTLEDARALAEVIHAGNRTFALTHAYTGYPMVRQARDVVASGRLGRVYKVIVDYLQGWLSDFHEVPAGPKMPWRTRRESSGIACTTADIGTHADNLARYVTGFGIRRLAARTNTFLPGNELDDDLTVQVEYAGGAHGVYNASQVATGERNSLSIRVYGDRAGLEWRQEHPNQLVIKERDLSHVVYDSGRSIGSDRDNYRFRLPPGHPEGLIEAFANVYADSLDRIRSGSPGTDVPGVPGIEDGLRGMVFTDLVVRSSASDSSWIEWPVG